MSCSFILLQNHKYSVGQKKHLYTAFANLSLLYDLIYKERLWYEFQKTNIDCRLLFLIKGLYQRERGAEKGWDAAAKRQIISLYLRECLLALPYLF